MRYSKSMIEAVKQVGLYEQFDYVVLDKDNKIVQDKKINKMQKSLKNLQIVRKKKIRQWEKSWSKKKVYPLNRVTKEK